MMQSTDASYSCLLSALPHNERLCRLWVCSILFEINPHVCVRTQRFGSRRWKQALWRIDWKAEVCGNQREKSMQEKLKRRRRGRESSMRNGGWCSCKEDSVIFFADELAEKIGVFWRCCRCALWSFLKGIERYCSCFSYVWWFELLLRESGVTYMSHKWQIIFCECAALLPA